MSPQGGAVTGVWIAVCLWGLLSWTGYYWGESMILSAVGAKEISHEIHPLLFNVVEEMKIAANLSAMPKIYIAGESAPNAFATGIQKEKCAVVVTVGLLTRLNRDELQGVVAHEMSHIANRDVLFMMLAGSTLGSIELISQFFLRGAISSGGSSRRYESGAPPKASGPLLVITLVVALVAALLAKIFYFSLSRKREFLADACAARYTRYPEGLASALEKISASNFPLTVAEGVVAPMCTVSPWLKEEGGELSTGLTDTHPPVTERVRILRAMAHGASYADYENAFSSIKKNSSPLIPASALRQTEIVPLRQAFAGVNGVSEKKESVREAGDLMRAVNQFAFFRCMCGLKFKVPGNFDEKQMTCPRCGIVNELPFFGKIGLAQTSTNSQETESASQRYVRRTKDWETFFCSCGKIVTLSPHLLSPQVLCPACGKRIEILASL